MFVNLPCFLAAKSMYMLLHLPDAKFFFFQELLRSDGYDYTSTRALQITSFVTA